MAASDARPIPRKGVAFRATFPIYDADGDPVTGATGLDSEVSKDAGTFADATNEATEIATSSGIYYLDLTASEMDADTVAVQVKTSSSGAKTTVLVLYPEEVGDVRIDASALATASALSTVASYLDTEVASILAAVDTEIAAIKAKTDNLPADPADQSVLEAAITAAQGAVTTAIAALNNLSSAQAQTAAAAALTAYDPPTHAEMTAELATADDATLAAIAARPSVADFWSGITATAARFIADHTLRRSWASAAVSANGDTLSFRSLLGAVAKLVNRVGISGATLTVYQDDDNTALGTQAVTSDAAASPITEVNTA